MTQTLTIPKDSDLPDITQEQLAAITITGHGSNQKSDRPKQIIKIKQQHPDLSTRQIAKLTDCTHSNVVQILQRYGVTQERTKDYINNRTQILAGLQEKLLASITDEELKKAPLGTKTLSFCQLYDKEALERGTATTIVRYDAASLRERYAELRSMLRETSTIVEVDKAQIEKGEHDTSNDQG